MPFEWGSPQYFVWLWVLPGVAALYGLAEARRRAQIRRFGEAPLMERLITSLDGGKRLLKRIFLLLAVFFIVLALAQPHFRKKEITAERRGLDIIIAVDVSHSMLAKDIAPTRLDKAKLELETLIEGLKRDRVGIVAFAGDAFIQCPLTTDKSAVKLFLNTLGPSVVPMSGTAVGRALQVGLRAFDDPEKEHKAMILLTDGEDHGTAPLEIAHEAKKAGVRIFTIGIGTPDGGTLPSGRAAGELKRDRQGNIVLSKLDEPLLKKIAAVTGGVYYRASRGEIEVESLLRQIRQMAERSLKKEKAVEYEENYQVFLALALGLLFLETAFSERKEADGGARGWRTAAAVFLILPLCGFTFYSKLKNEEGNKHYKAGRIGKARASYEKALRSDPSSREVAFNLGNAYHREGSFTKSLDAYGDSAAAEAPPLLKSMAFYNIGNTLYRRGELESAKEYYKKALRLNPRDGDAKHNLEILEKKSEEKKEEPKRDQNQRQDQKESSPQDEKNEERQEEGGQEGPPQSSQGKEEERQEGAAGRSPASEGEEEPMGETEGGKERPKTAAEERARQILDALAANEQETLKIQGDRRPDAGARVAPEKDW